MKTNINRRFLINKSAFFILSFILVCFSFKAQPIQDFSVKNSSNDIERKFMLDLLRTKIKSEFKQNAKFSVNHFLVSGNYAWFTGGVMRSDGSRLVFPKDVDYYDCCHIEALFEKDRTGKWKIAESYAFSTDVWYTCIGIRYPLANPKIFTPGAMEDYCQ
jgi:hypothetical protein